MYIPYSLYPGIHLLPPPPPWTEFLTHACENNTFPQLLKLKFICNSNLSQLYQVYISVKVKKLHNIKNLSKINKAKLLKRICYINRKGSFFVTIKNHLNLFVQTVNPLSKYKHVKHLGKTWVNNIKKSQIKYLICL